MSQSPAKYPESSIAEIDAVKVFEAILDHTFVKSDIKILDKVPNYDGFIELTNPDQTPIGKIEVQIKKLPDKDLSSPKYQCEAEFLSYCQNSILPVFLIVVDLKSKVAYWKFMSRDFIAALGLIPNQKSKCISFDKDDIVKEGDHKYVSSWTTIIKECQKKLSTYNSLYVEKEKIKSEYKLLSENSECTMGLVDNKFSEIHTFLDFLNSKFDADFKFIKGIFFPGCWKIGFAFLRYQESDISYVLYPISQDKNDIQIKKINDQFLSKLQNSSQLWFTHYANNPVKNRPENYAFEIIYRRLQTVLKSRIMFANSIVTAQEFFFYFIDTLHIPLGISVCDEYNIAELRGALEKYFPVWLDVSSRMNGVRLSDNDNSVQPSFILSQLSHEKTEKINREVERKLVEKKYIKITRPLGDDFYLFDIFSKILGYLESNKIKKVQRLFIPPDEKRIKDKRTAFIWSYWSAEAVKKNIQVLFREVPNIYNLYVNTFFPQLKKELHFFENFDRLVVIVREIKDEYNSIEDEPRIEYCYLANTAHKEEIIDVYFDSDKNAPILKATEIGQVIQLGNEEYKFLAKSWQRLDFIFGNLPITDFVYRELEERFRSYFGKKGVS